MLAVADGDAGDEFNALGGHEVNAPLHHVLPELHVWNAVGQKPTHSVRALVNHHLVPNAIELRRSGEARGARAHHGYALPGAPGGDLRRHPPLFEAPLNNCVFDVLDRHRRIGDPKHAGPFAGRRANPSRKLGEIVGLQKPIEGIAPAALVYQIIPFGDQVIDRATVGLGLAERHATIHAASPLRSQSPLIPRGEDFFVVEHAYLGGAIGCRLPRKLLKACGLTHGRAP